MLDYIRIACAVPAVKVGDVEQNARDICRYLESADAENADVILFPEMALTGYSCGDLLFQDALWNAVKAGLRQIADCSGKHPNITAVLGLPVRVGVKIYNCAAVVVRGEVAGLVPKTHLTMQEKRWFSSGAELKNIWLEPEAIGLAHSEDYYSVPVNADQLFCMGDNAMVGIELCQDGMMPRPRCGDLTVSGAEVVLNLSASHELVGKQAYRRNLVQYQSGACSCIYAFVSSGYTESTTDLVYSGHSIIAENGSILMESDKGLYTDYQIIMDCDLGRVRAERRKNQNFGPTPENWLITQSYGDTLRADGSLYPVKKLPFVPADAAACSARCREVFQLQVTGLKQRLRSIGANAVVGVSGGLDSTLALLVAVEAMRQLGRPVSDVYGVTMPCFGTSERTYSNAWKLMGALGVQAKEISILEAVTGHFADIGHDASVHNATYENAQARERTQVLMDYASVVGGIVIGTGDMSEMALGWCTYNGDHMSMYGVNSNVPKTLIPRIIETVAQNDAFATAASVLRDIVDTPISPELLPPDETGKISQQTEDLVGPYALHDFYLYHMLRYGFAPKKIYALACRAFTDEFAPAVIKKWLSVFYRRFFSQQFKRNCMPDGVKVGSVSLGPRGDWKMPSDACGKLWTEETENL